MENINPLKAWRIKNNLSQEQVAELFTQKAKELNINDKWKGHYIVSRKESGAGRIDPIEAKILEELTGLPRNWFLYPEEHREEIENYLNENKPVGAAK